MTNFFAVAKARIGTRVHLRYEDRVAHQEWTGRLLTLEPMRDDARRLGLALELRAGGWRDGPENALKRRAWHADWHDGEDFHSLRLGPFERVLALNTRASVEIKQPDGSTKTIPLGERQDSGVYVLDGARRLTVTFLDA